MNPLPFVNFHTHHPSHEGELSLGGEEHGLDKRWSIPMEMQEEEFRQWVRQSEEEGRHLTIHCVRAMDNILRIHREMRPRQAWIFHGFRGKPQQLRSLLAAGMYVSFGWHYNTDSLLLCPMDRLCIETDDNPGPIRPLYEEIARLRGISTEELQAYMLKNMSEITQKGLTGTLV